MRCTGGSSERSPADDPAAAWRSSSSLRPLAGRRVLDLGCGKGRFARALGRARAQRWSGSTSRRRCSPRRRASIGSARRPGGCRSARRASTPSIAVEVFEHLAPRVARPVCGEVRRVLRPGGTLGDRRQERVLVERPAAVAAERGGEVDRRAPGPLDVFPSRAGPRALVPARGAASGGSAGGFRRCGSSTCSRRPSRAGFRFSSCPARGCSCSGRRRRREGPRDGTVFADAGVAAAAPVEDAAGAGADPRPGRRAVRDGQRPAPARRSAAAGSSCSTAGGRRAARSAASSGPEHVAIDVDGLRRGEPVDPFEALVDNTAALGSWAVGPWTLSERVARYAQGVDSPPADRPAARGRHRGGGRLDPAGPVSVPVSLGLQLPGRPRRAGARGLPPLRRGPGAAGRLLHAFRQHPRLCPSSVGPRRPEAARHAVARAFPSRLPRAGGQSGQPGACPPDPLELGLRAGRRSPRRTAAGARPRRPARRPRLPLLVRLPARLRRPAVLSLEGGPILAGASDPGPSGLRGPVPGGRRRRPGSRSATTSGRSSARSSMRASWPSSTAIPSAGWAGCPRS